MDKNLHPAVFDLLREHPRAVVELILRGCCEGGVKELTDKKVSCLLTEQCIAIAEKLGDKELLAEALVDASGNLADLYPEKALVYAMRALSLAERDLKDADIAYYTLQVYYCADRLGALEAVADLIRRGVEWCGKYPEDCDSIFREELQEALDRLGVAHE